MTLSPMNHANRYQYPRAQPYKEAKGWLFKRASNPKLQRQDIGFWKLVYKEKSMHLQPDVKHEFWNAEACNLHREMQ